MNAIRSVFSYRPFTIPLRAFSQLKRFNDIFDEHKPQPKLGSLDKDFRQRAFQLVDGTKPLDDFSHEEKATVDAFVTYDEDFQIRAQELRESKKPIEDLSPEERRTMEFYVNFDKEFRQIAEEAQWREHPRSDIDEIRTLDVNFNTKYKNRVKSLTNGLNCNEQNDYERQVTFLCVNYHRELEEKAKALIKGTTDFEKLDQAELTTLKNYVNLHKGFERQASDLIEGFRTIELLSEEEKKTVQLFVRYNLKHRKKLVDNPQKSSHVFQGSWHSNLFYNCALCFDPEVQEKIQKLMWGRRKYRDLLPSEQNIVHTYVNFSDAFKKADAFKNNSFNISFYKHGSTRSLHFSRRELRCYETFTMCDEKYLEKAKWLVFGDKEIEEFTDHENGIVKFYVHHNYDFQKLVNQLLTKPFERLSSAEKRVFSLSYAFDDVFRDRIKRLVDSIKEPELFTSEESKLVTLYVNCMKDFKKEAAKLVSTKKEYSAFELEEERVGTLYVNFDVNFQMEAQKLIGEHRKKGGFHDFDQKLRYPPMQFNLFSNPLFPNPWFRCSVRGGLYTPKHELFETEKKVEPEVVIPPPETSPKVDFTLQEEVTMKLYLYFHLDYRNKISEILSRNAAMTEESKRIFDLGMWYDQELRDDVFSTIWDAKKAQKIVDGTSENFCLGPHDARNAARLYKHPRMEDEWTYYFLGFNYYKIPLDPDGIF